MLRIIFTLGYSFTFLLLSLLVAKHWLGELIAIGPRNQMNYWNTEHQKVDQQTWASAEQALNLSHRLRGDEPSLLLDIARMAAWNPENSNLANENALVLTEKATERFPLSSLAWAQVAFYRSFTNKDITQILSAFDRALELGRYREPGLMLLLQVGFRHWQDLGFKRQEIVRYVVAHSEHGFIADMVLRYDMLKHVYTALRPRKHVMLRIMGEVKSRARTYNVRNKKR